MLGLDSGHCAGAAYVVRAESGRFALSIRAARAECGARRETRTRERAAVRAIILSAGQGRRLFPVTRELPKCLVPVDGSRTLLEVQLRELAAHGVRDAIVMGGFGIEKVERFAESHPVPKLAVRVRYNPFFNQADNLITAWLASRDFDGDCLLLNGDTLFEGAVVRRLLTSPPHAVTIVVNRKSSYDDDDMKVRIDGGWVRAIGKDLSPGEAHGEAIGMTLLRGPGPGLLREALERLVRRFGQQRTYYTAALGELAQAGGVRPCAMDGLWWGEVDSLEDLEVARKAYAARGA
jgi:choline kinase